MGSSLDRFLGDASQNPTGAPVPNTPGANPSLDSFLSGAQNAQTLPLAADLGSETAPDQATRIWKLQQRTGFDPAFIARNLDSLEVAARRADFDPAKYRKESPLVAQWLSEHPNNFAMASQDLTKLSYIERQLKYVQAQFQQGRLASQLWRIGERAMTGDATPEDRQTQADIENQMASYSSNYGVTGFFEGIPGAIANQLPLLKDMLVGKVKYALAGAGAGVISGTIAGGAAGIPTGGVAEPITLPAGAVSGFEVGGLLGWRYGAAVMAARQEMGLSYLDFEKIKDENGQPLDHATAMGAAIVDGVINGALQSVGFEKLSQSVPGLRLLGRGELRQALARQTVRQAIGGYLKNIGEAAAAQGIVGFLQSMVRSSAGTIAQMASDGRLSRLSTGAILSQVFNASALDQAVQAGKTGVQMGGGIAAGMGSLGLMHDIGRARTAEANAAAFRNIGSAVGSSELAERAPEAMQQIVGRLTENGPTETLYHPIDTWTQYWQSQHLDPGAVAEEVTGSRDAYDEAQRTGGDLPIPTAAYAARLAGTPHNEILARELRAAPDQMNQREAEEFYQKLDAMEQQQQQEALAQHEQSATQVGDQVRSQLIDAGFDEKTAANYAKLYERGFLSLGARTGMDPLELFKQYGLRISRPQEMGAVAGTLEQRPGIRLAPMPEPTGDNIVGNPQLNGPFVDLYHVTPAENLPDIINSGKLDNTQAKSNIQGYPAAVKGIYGWSTLERAIFEVDRMNEQLDTPREDMAIVHLRVPRDANMVPDEDVNTTFEDSYLNNGTSARQGGADLSHVRAIYTSSQDPAVREALQSLPNTYEQGAQEPRLPPGMYSKAEQVVEQKMPNSATVEDSMFQPAYHGTPHLFDEFSTRHIGSGEGAQSYGWGLYFTAKKGLAEWYRDKLTPSAQTHFNALTPEENKTIPGWIRSTLAASLPSDKETIVESIRARIGEDPLAPIKPDDDPEVKALKKLAQSNDFSSKEVKQGRLFKVDIPEDETLLDYDKILRDQPPKVLEALEYLWPGSTGAYLTPGKSFYGDLLQQINDYPESIPAIVLQEFAAQHNMTVKEFFDLPLEARAPYAPELASRSLASEGINGIRYQGANVDGTRNPNFVIFDDRLIKIMSYEQAKKPTITAAIRVKVDGNWKTFDGQFHPQAYEDFLSWSEKHLTDEQHNQAENSMEEGFLVNGKWMTRDQTEQKYGFGSTDEQFGEDDFEQQTQPTLEPRGLIRIGSDEISIELLKDADLSTFVHETGHFYLHVLEDLATGKDAPKQIVDDYNTIRKYLGVKDDELIQRKHHETFARSFEAYLMEGKAPSTELQGPFARFRAWLVGIYSSVQNLGVSLTPEVRNVFDRLLAGDHEITSAEQQQHFEPLFADPEAYGMSPERAAHYRDAIQAARAAAEEMVATRIQNEFQREQSRVWRAERARIAQEVDQVMNEDPVARARSILTRGKMPDGSEPPETLQGLKLNKTAINAMWGPEVLKALPKPYVYTEIGGLHPDVAADLLGFESGDQLLKSLWKSEPVEGQKNRLIEERLRQVQHDVAPMDASELATEAMDAVHNEKRAQLLHEELKVLAARNLPALKGLVRAVARPLPSVKEIREQAGRIIGNKKVRELTPGVYQRAEATAGRMAVEALLRGDVEHAFDEKQRQLLNHELYRAAQQAKQDVDKIVNYMAKFETNRVRERLAKAGGEYLAQIDAIRSRFDFTKSVSLKELAHREDIREFVKRQNDLGIDVTIPDAVMQEAYKQHYKDTSLDTLRGIRDAVKQIEHLALLKNKLLASVRSRRVSEAVAEMTAGIRAFHAAHTEVPDFAEGLRTRVKKGAKGFFAAHTKPEFLFEWLDGNKEQGPVWSYLFKPFVEAENNERARMREAAKALRDIFSAYPREERATWFWHKESFDEMGQFTKANKLALALNWGNEYNREAVLRGHGWTEAQVQRVLDTLDERDWKTVQAVWNHLNTYWPDIAKLEEDLNGLPPGKVEASPVRTKFGDFEGGYYPIVFDASRSWRQSTIDAKEQTKQLFGGFWARAMTKHGHTEARNNTGGKPILLELTGLTRHVSNVIHDLTHRRAVIDVERLTQHPEFRQTLEQTVGREMYKQIHPWLVNIAAGQRQEFVNPIESILSHARMGATVVHLGWKMTTAVAQWLSYTSTVKEIGAKYSSLGLADVYSKPWKFKDTWSFVTSRSEFMKDRLTTYDRDVNDVMKRMNVAGTNPGPLSTVTANTTGLRDSFFTFVGLMDMAASLPSWMGAYRKVMEGNVEGLEKGNEQAAIDYADKVVRQTQGVGAAKDLATVQRGPEVYKIFTMFYSYWSVLFNQFAKTQHQFQFDKNIPRYVASLAMLWFAPAALNELMIGQTPSTDDDKEEWLKWLAKTEFEYPFQTIILVRDIINGMVNREYDPSAAFGMFDALTKTGQALGQRVFGDKDEFTRSDIHQMVNAAGYVTKLPTNQLWLTGEYLHDWLTGDVSENPAQALWHGVVTGKPKE